MAIGGTMVLARNELLALVHAIDQTNNKMIPYELLPLLPEIRRRLMTEVNRIDTEGDW